MAHRIEEFADGTAAFASARLDAWHKLGTTLDDVFTAEQAMDAAHLGGWDVRKTPLTTNVIGDDGVTQLDVPEKYATVRTHPKTGEPEVLGVVGSTYQPVQNEAHCELLNTLVDESGAHFETAGSLYGGRQVFVTMKLPETMRVGDTDDVDLYIAGLNSHDGSSAFRFVVTPVRVVCANTQAAALGTARSSFSIRHTSGAQGKIAEARQALGLTWKYLESFEAEAEKMIQETLRQAEFTKMVEKVFPVEPNPTAQAKRNAEERVSQLRYLFNDADTLAPVRGTRWAGYQAVAEYLDHYAPVKTRGEKAEARALRTLTGSRVADQKARAFELMTV